MALLASTDFGRIGVIEDGFPLILPVNHRVAVLDGEMVIAIRTRPGNVIDRPDERVCFEVDGVDRGHDSGWSVLVRGTLRVASKGVHIDSRPLLDTARTAWLIIVPVAVTGRRLIADPLRWTFHSAGYL